MCDYEYDCVLKIKLLFLFRGVSYVNQSVKEEEINESFVTLKAPRTVIGSHSNGSLFLVQVY